MLFKRIVLCLVKAPHQTIKRYDSDYLIANDGAELFD